MGISRKLFIRSFLVGAIVSVLVFLLSWRGYLDRWENGIFDFLMWWDTEKRSADVLLVGIDSSDFKTTFHSTSPLSRQILAEAILKLARSKPKAIGLNVVFEGETSEDASLTDALQVLNRDNVPIVFPLLPDRGKIDGGQTPGSGPAPAQAPLSTALTPNVFFGGVQYRDSCPGGIREMPLLMIDGQGLVPSFPLAVAAAAAGLTPQDLADELAEATPSGRRGESGPNKIRSLIRGHRHAPLQRIHFIGDRKSFGFFRFSLVSDTPAEAFQPGNIFTDKVVLVGEVFEESKDIYATPKGRLSGVEIIANSVETLLRSNPIRPVHHVLELAFELAAVLVLSYFFLRFTPLKASFWSFLLIIPLALAGSSLAFGGIGRWLNFIPAALAVILHGISSVMARYPKLGREVEDLADRLRRKDEEIFRLRDAGPKRGQRRMAKRGRVRSKSGKDRGG